MATPILEIPEVSTSILSFALLNIVLRHYEQAASNRIVDSLTTPPGLAVDGEAYFILAGATGLWNGRDGDIAFSISGAWYFMKAIPQLPYLKTSTNTLVTLDPVTATEGPFSSGGGGGGGASYYNLVTPASGVVSVPFDTYPTHSVVFIDCSAVTDRYMGFNLNLTTLSGSGGKKVELIFYNVPSNVLYMYRTGPIGGFNIPIDNTIYRNNELFYTTYEVDFTTNRLLLHNASQPTEGYAGNNYSTPASNTVVVEGRHKKGTYTYDGSSLVTGSTLTLTWDDNYIQDVYTNLVWKIVIFNLPVTVTSVVVAAPSGAGTFLYGILAKTPTSDTVSYEWIFSSYHGAFIVS